MGEGIQLLYPSATLSPFNYQQQSTSVHAGLDEGINYLALYGRPLKRTRSVRRDGIFSETTRVVGHMKAGNFILGTRDDWMMSLIDNADYPGASDATLRPIESQS